MISGRNLLQGVDRWLDGSIKSAPPVKSLEENQQMAVSDPIPIQWPAPDGATPSKISDIREAQQGGKTATAGFEIDLSGRDPEDELEGAYKLDAIAGPDRSRAAVDLDLSLNDDPAPEITIRSYIQESRLETGQAMVEGHFQMSIRSGGGDQASPLAIRTQLSLDDGPGQVDLFG